MNDILLYLIDTLMSLNSNILNGTEDEEKKQKLNQKLNEVLSEISGVDQKLNEFLQLLHTEEDMNPYAEKLLEFAARDEMLTLEEVYLLQDTDVKYRFAFELLKSKGKILFSHHEREDGKELQFYYTTGIDDLK